MRSKLYLFVASAVMCLLVLGCSVSYKFNGGAIDYTQIKTISIGEVFNKAPVVYPPLAGDLELNCTITGYDLAPMSIGQDNFAERTVFTVTVQVKFTNRANEKESFDRSFKAYRDFPRSQPFVAVQDDLLREITEDLIKQIFNATVENW